MVIVYTLLLLLIILGSCAICYVILYNKIQSSISKVEKAESIIDETLRERYDLIISANTIIENSIKEKKNLLKGLDKLKEENISNFDLDRKLTEYIQLINKLKLDFDVLNSDKEFKKIVGEFKVTEERLHATKSYYNKYTSELNDLIRKFPSNIIAKMHGVTIRNFFDGKDMHDDITNDFKL